MSIPPTYLLSDLTLVAASREQAKVSRQNTFPYWGVPRGFTMDKYLERDEIMEKEEWGADGHLITWVLVPRSDTSTTTEILSHCETYRRSAVVIPPSSSSSDDEVKIKPVVAYGIASVYTPPDFRRKGYGKHMLQLLHYSIAPSSLLPPFPSAWGAPPPPPPQNRSQDASFAVLYSDIGKEFYKSCRQGEGKESRDGWVEMGSVGRFWVLDDDDEGSIEERVEWLDRAGVKGFEEEMSGRLLSALKEGRGPGEEGKRRVAFLPTGGLLSLHPLRSLLSDPPVPSSLPSRTFGFKLPPSPIPSSPQPVLTYTFSDEAKPYQTLLVTHVSGPVPFSSVVAAARRERCGRIEIWDDDEVSRKWKDGKGREGVWKVREDHLSALVDYEGGEGELQWVHNEKYAWC